VCLIQSPEARAFVSRAVRRSDPMSSRTSSRAMTPGPAVASATESGTPS
jgi:hypothetical protein